MPWGRVDDTFHSHPKVVTMPAEIRLAAVGLFWMAVSWSNAHSTDGRLRAGVAEVLGGTQEQASALVRARLWHRRGKGYEIHDFLQFNASAAETAERSAVRSRAGRLGALKRWQTDGTVLSVDGKPMAPANGTAMANDAPVPSRPIPVLPEKRTPPPPTRGGRRRDRTNPRATGASPRQVGDSPRDNGTSIRAEREDQKRGPTSLREIVARLQEAEAKAPEPMPPAPDPPADAGGWFEKPPGGAA